LFFFSKKKVPIIPDYLYHLQNPKSATDDIYKFLAKNCSNTELIRHRSYFVRHPVNFQGVLRTYCNWTVGWAMNKTEFENKQRTIILEHVRIHLLNRSRNSKKTKFFF